MSFAIQPISKRTYSSSSRNNTIKAKQNSDMSFEASFSRLDTTLAGLGLLGTTLATPGGLEFFGLIKTQVPIVVTMLGLSLPVISILGIFGSRKTHP